MHETQKLIDENKIFFFGDLKEKNEDLLKEVLGGKGAGLSIMTNAGLPVPPGFTIGINCCREYQENDSSWPTGLEGELKDHIKKLELKTGKKFGIGSDPLLVSVRSGAAKSMPGMLDTILNCGLHLGLEEVVQNKNQFWSVYKRFVEQFASTIANIKQSIFETKEREIIEMGLGDKEISIAFAELYELKTGKKFPNSPWDCLYECVNAIFDSWNNERAVVYRKAHNLENLQGTSVTIQSMFNSVVSGIGFTANPSNPSSNEIILESGYGLGESIVSGDVTPDRYVLHKDSLQIKEKVIGDKCEAMYGLGTIVEGVLLDPHASSLTDDQIIKIAKIALQVEAFFGYPVDIEWGLNGDQIYLLQSRAIRGLDLIQDIEEGRLEEIARLENRIDNKEMVWISHNLGETLPNPKNMTWDIISEFMSGNGGYGLMYKDFGYRPSKIVCEEGFLELINGRIYIDPIKAAQSFWEGLPYQYDIDEIKNDPHLIESAPTKFNVENTDESFLFKLPNTVWAMFKSTKKIKKARKDSLRNFLELVVPKYLSYLDELKNKDLSSLSLKELTQELEFRVKNIMCDFGKESLKPGFFGGCARSELESLLIQFLGDKKGKTLCNDLTSGLANDSTVEQNELLYQVAIGKAKIENFIDLYGHRSVGEMELSHKRWREDSDYLDTIMENMTAEDRNSPFELHQKNEKKRLEAMESLPDLLKEYGGSFKLEQIVGLAREAQNLLPYRETGKHYLMMGYELIRDILILIGERMGIGDDIFYLQRTEIMSLNDSSDTLLNLTKKRKLRWASAQKLDMPNLIDSQTLFNLGLPRELKNADEYEGTILSSGVTEGYAKIVFHPADAKDLGDQCVLVCPSTDPSWTALFTSIKGLIVEKGGVLSHGAITARDFGLPAVAYPDVTKMIKEGTYVRVDGDSGKISIIKEGVK